MLTPDVLFALTVGAAVGCGLIGGLLFAFSSFVMSALIRQPAGCGIRTMQAINVGILNPLFLSAFLGTAVASAALLVTSLWSLNSRGDALLSAGATLYLVGVFGITAMLNVPLNNTLEALDAASSEAARFWPAYVRRWTRWNHVRTVCALLASVLLTIAAALT